MSGKTQKKLGTQLGTRLGRRLGKDPRPDARSGAEADRGQGAAPNREGSGQCSLEAEAHGTAPARAGKTERLRALRSRIAALEGQDGAPALCPAVLAPRTSSPEPPLSQAASRPVDKRSDISSGPAACAQMRETHPQESGAGANLGQDDHPGFLRLAHGASADLCADISGLRLAFGALHEIAGTQERAYWSGLGFTLALAGVCARLRRGAVVWVREARFAQDYGVPHAWGLPLFGVRPGRVVLVCPETDKDVLWGLEAAVQEARIAAVVGEIPPPAGGRERGYGLTASRRLHLAAQRSGVPLLIFRGRKTGQPSAARSRWLIAPGARRAEDDWAPRWQADLEMCRAGPGQVVHRGRWDLEWDHEAYRFRLAAPLADRPPVPGPAHGRAGSPVHGSSPAYSAIQGRIASG